MSFVRLFVVAYIAEISEMHCRCRSLLVVASLFTLFALSLVHFITRSPSPQAVYYRAKVGDRLFCGNFQYQTPDAWPTPRSTVTVLDEPQLAHVSKIVDVVAYQTSIAPQNMWHTLVQVIGSVVTSIGSDALFLPSTNAKIWIDREEKEVVAFAPFWDKLEPYALSSSSTTFAHFCYIGPSEKCRLFGAGDRSNTSTPYCDHEYRAMRQFFGASCLKQRIPGKVVVISREKTTYRRVVNWPFFLETIERQFVNTNVVALEDMNLCEQISTISSASVVIALRGAGQALSLFMSDGATFVNVYHPKQYWFPLPAQMAHWKTQQLGAEEDVYCPGSHNVCNDLHNNWADWLIDVNKLEDVLLRVE